MTAMAGIDPVVAPSGTGCAECEAVGGWWLHLRRCAQCGHIGCCDTSPSQHASAHAAATGHPVIRSFEPGEDWFWSYATNEFYESGPGAGPAGEPSGRPARPWPGRPGAPRLAHPPALGHALDVRGRSAARPAAGHRLNSPATG